MSKDTDRRRNPRQDVLMAAMVTPNGGQHEATILNLSRGGACVALPTDWMPGDGAPLKLFFQKDNDEPIMVHAHVARIAVDHMGLSFDPGQGTRIRDLLELTRPH
ncbi:PilZ domain-containing protein [Lysobacter niastensis]|uniref:PilZ domain-containing protein n=1 Tax=Lysobacter niastensis TaxID=380629 RepID=A0ABS0B9I5_9GAMM|nr:PilZ domain-containing protein [Lysobacter niastensis]MBF6025661.1 PilZ domain-containing protein [Lysobacter niastensis]